MRLLQTIAFIWFAWPPCSCTSLTRGSSYSCLRWSLTWALKRKIPARSSPFQKFVILTSKIVDTPTSTTAQLLTVPPYLIAACVSLIIPWWSDRRQTRGLFIIFVPFVAVLGFLLLAFAPWVWRKDIVTLLVTFTQLKSTSFTFTKPLLNCLY